MTQPFRLSSGGRIDRGKPVFFRFDGRQYQGFEGDTLASALLANGVRIAGRSFRFHRPRGVFAAGCEEPNVVVQLGKGALTEPNLKATEVTLGEGLEARAVNAWPSARIDIGAITDWFSPLLPAGFYYKTFMIPRWSLYSGAIRRLAGLGRAPEVPDTAQYAWLHEHCDVLVIGGGPAGIAAAMAAAQSGARVIVVESQNEFGGSLLWQGETIDRVAGARWAEQTVKQLAVMENVTLLPGCTAFGYYDHNTIGLISVGRDSQRLRLVRAGQVVLATGSFERPLVFRNNDRPNVMLASAARTYLNRFAVAPGRRVAIATNNDSVYDFVLELAEKDVTVAAVADVRDEPPLAYAEALRKKAIRHLTGYAPVNTGGRRALRSVTFATVGGHEGARVEIACDALCVSGGWNPAVHLFSQSGGRIRYDMQALSFVPDEWTQAGATAGAVNGAETSSEAVEQGRQAGITAARAAGFEPKAQSTTPRARPDDGRRPPKAFWQADGAHNGRAWVDLLNDVTSADIRQAVQENYRSVEHLKRYTTLGMAVDQGKTSNIAAIGILSEVLAKPIGEVGTTKFRPPFNPVRFGALAGGRSGRFFHPLKRLPAHASHIELGATMEDYGGWSRPALYPRKNEVEEETVCREILAVRRGVGIFDASPLGKLRVAGPDAAEFLNRVYLNEMKSLKAGRCRYGIMLNEGGIVFDDGVLSRISENEFLVGTTSARATDVALWLEEWLQCEWTNLEVVVEDVTAALATVTIAGPKALALLRTLGMAEWSATEALPHMAFHDSVIGSVPCRIARVSFTGERSYELSVPSGYGEALWRACIENGKPFDAVPVGIEATTRLRLEKGFIHVGSDTDATTFPQDLGFARAIARKTGDFVGRRSTMLPEAMRDGRRQLVGIEPLSPAAVVVGSHVVNGKRRSEGWVTSAGFSPTLGRFVALGLVENGSTRLGEEISLVHLGKRTQARLCAPRFYDPEGLRLNA